MILYLMNRQLYMLVLMNITLIKKRIVNSLMIC